MALAKFPKDIAIGIYSITNTIDNKMYIGQSINIYKRMRYHISIRGLDDRLLSVAMRVHGIDKFKFEILELCDKSDLLDREIYWIKKNNSIYPNGYNKANGLGTKGIKMPDKVREILKKVNINRVPSREALEKSAKVRKILWADPEYRKAHSGKNSPTYGRKPAEEEMRNLLEHHAHNRPVNRRCVDMLDIKTNNILLCFLSMTDAARWLTLDKKDPRTAASCISSACSGKYKSSHGYKWQYNNEGN